jgi:hypothetical protein
MPPQNRIRLTGYPSSALNNLTYNKGEIVYDETLATLRLLDGVTAGGIGIATRPWVEALLEGADSSLLSYIESYENTAINTALAAHVLTFTGDATGTGVTNIALTLAASGVTAGTANGITVNSKGLVTAISEIVVSGDVTGTVSGHALTLTLINTAVTPGTVNGITVNSKGLVTGMTALTSVPTLTSFGTSSVNTTANGNLIVSGNLTVNGTVTTVNSTTVNTAEKVLVIASGATTDAQANGSGLQINGSTAKTLQYLSGNNAFNSSENLNLVTGKSYQINGVTVLNSTTLGSNITTSSLTSLGTLTSLTVSGASTLASLTVSGASTLASLTVSGASTLASVTVSGNAQFASVSHNTNVATVNSNYALNCATYNVWFLTVSGTFALSTTNVPSGLVIIYVYLYYTGSTTITWPTGTIWPSGTVPGLTNTVGKTDIFALNTVNGGSSWYGALVGQNY